ncbi:MAG TPA: single-stranded-DNA-specific exonuclease RecJ [Anaerolineae bacterium]|nr:single-stranded-DNA-specific exonuclease RecJ [Anaerolineae bacterium]
MSVPFKRWQVSPRAPDSHFAQFPQLPPLIVQLLYNRGVTSPEEVQSFLDHHCDGDDPFALLGMRAAVERISCALARQEAIAVYGDYDCDGVTSTALLTDVLARLGAQVEAYIPNRFEEGYGLNNEALADLVARGVKLVITVDCGIRSVAEVAYGNSLGLDLIITDHHHVGEQVPPALAAINPKQRDCSYPFKELAGVGLAYKLGQALLHLYPANGVRADDYLDLVAVGTVADLAPLYQENRKLVSQGLRLLNRSLRPGLAALMAQAAGNSNSVSAVSAGTIGFTIGPRLNAAGRLDNALAAYKLLIADNPFEANQLAAQLELQNRERQKLTGEMVDAARQRILETGGQQPIYFVRNSAFNPGVVGLAASRLTDEFYRPVLVAEEGSVFTKGSARSIAEFHITEALDQCAHLLERYGGHAAAAGFTLKNENFEELTDLLQKIAGQQLDPSRLRPTLSVDGEVNLRGVSPALVEAISNLQPFGYGNPTPRFLSRRLLIRQIKAVGQDGHHLRLILHDGKQPWNAIAFRQGVWAKTLKFGDYIDAVYSLEFNEWNGQRSMQLNIKDLRPPQ